MAIDRAIEMKGMERLDEAQTINPLYPSDAIWDHRTWSTLVQVMAWCLRAPSHYLNQCWLTMKSGHIHLRACLFSKSSLARLQEFWNSSICLYEINRKNLFKSTCPSGSFTCPGPLRSGNYGNGEPCTWWQHAHEMLKISITRACYTSTVTSTNLWDKWVNSLAPEDFCDILDLSYFQANFTSWWLRYLMWNHPQRNVTRPYLW